ncbi:DUF349 domain-containing protein [Ostreibacterium oceani]|uniref:DUF349 domain-containing protein n=1 Tax=Ostreibacterium oceani TaxID=2654998 RepID=A0A6N7F009_9GAMM|nr:DUF349 domain-containing protein [Ostreibacterium oceani]MPV86108.1 DUF349 domain-containing protein [Ostreibacterium oceani]
MRFLKKIFGLDPDKSTPQSLKTAPDAVKTSTAENSTAEISTPSESATAKAPAAQEAASKRLKDSSSKNSNLKNSNPKKRIEWIKSIADIELMLDCYQDEQDEIVIDCADMRLRELLTEQTEAVPIARIKSASLSFKTQKTLAAAAALPELRQHFLDQCDDDQSLNEIIARTQDVQIKRQAIDKLSDTDALQALVKQAKGKDKAQYRLAKSRLVAVRERQQTKLTLDAQATTLQSQIDTQTVSEASVAKFTEQLAAVSPDLTASARQHYQQILTMAQAAAQELRQFRDARHEILATVSDLNSQLTAGDFSGDETVFRRLVDKLQQAWQDLPIWQSAERETFDIRFEQALGQLNEAAAPYFREKTAYQAQQRLLTQGQRWISTQTFVSANMIADWQSRWEALPIISDQVAANDLNTRYRQVLDSLQAKAQRLQAQQLDNDANVPKLMAELRQYIDAGELQPALTAQNDIRKRLQSEARLSKAVHQSIIGEFSTLQQRIHELKSWQNFGSQQARETLVEAMQALAEKPNMDPELKAEAVQALQKRWKAVAGRAPQSLWDRFQHASDAAWAPCATYFSEQRQQSSELLAERLAFLAAAKSHIQRIDWDKPNWSAIDSAFKKFESAWKNFPKLQEKDYIKAKHVYKSVAKSWEGRLAAERKNELARRESIIQRANALADTGVTSDNAAAVISTIKQLKNEWAPTVPLRRRQQEQALWQRFQTACEKVYSQHDRMMSAERSERDTLINQYNEQLGALQACVENAATIADLMPDYRKRLDALADFADAPAFAQHRLNQRLEKINTLVSNKKTQEKQAQQQQQLDCLRQQDAYCTQLETVSLSESALADLRDKWQALTATVALTDGQSAMQARFEAAIAAQQSGSLPDGRETQGTHHDLARAKAIALTLEISSDMNSPATFQADRQAMQLANLDAALNGDKSFEHNATPEGRYALAVEWFALPKGGLATSDYPLSDWQQRIDNVLSQTKMA